MTENPSPESESESEVPEFAWDLSREVPREFRDAAWRLLGQTRKRDVFLTVRELAESGPMQAAEIGRQAAEKPHFDSGAQPDLSDNGDLEALCKLLIGFPVPKLTRPEHWYFVPFQPMCEYLVNPFHSPTSPKVQAAIEYLRLNNPEMLADTNVTSEDESEAGNNDAVPIDMSATEAHTYIRLAEHLECVAPKVKFSEFRPDDFGGEVGKGFVIEGTLVTEEMNLKEDSTVDELKNTLGEVFTEYVDHVAHRKSIFQIGLYQGKHDDCIRKEVRKKAISDKAGFVDIDPDFEYGHLTFRWKTEPILIPSRRSSI
ncbi:hypothetical protein [Natronoglomus mannanivorans]|uniref:Uncharacterized protein n=1 Tax=Natronoglomus mannanivorans TaxID=2979990 RepID=A0AAP3E3W9_9EURY|nr:hypothetical protein [Halobacteria archaeon AArc-xg1-1]